MTLFSFHYSKQFNININLRLGKDVIFLMKYLSKFTYANFEYDLICIEYYLSRQIYLKLAFFDSFDEFGFQKRFRLSKEAVPSLRFKFH